MTHGDASLLSSSAGSAVGLLERLQRESDAAVTACEADARSAVLAARESAEDAADARRREALSARERQHAQETRAARDLAQQRVVAATLAARADAIERVIVTANAQADLLATHTELPDRLRSDIAQALRYLADDAVTVRCPASIASLAREAAAAVDARIRVVVDPAVPFGIVVESGDGLVSVNATIARRIVGDRRRVMIRVAQLLDESFA